MEIIDKQKFLSYKQSDTIYILGSGPSVNSINEYEWEKIEYCDSITFNWFCKHGKFEPTFYIVREQANIPKRRSNDETPSIFIDNINKYKKCCFIVHDLYNHSPHAYSYVDNLDKIMGKGIVVKDVKLGSMDMDIFEHGVYHGSLTLNNVLHVAKYLGYKKMVFVGIDLKDSRYFWLHDKKRHTIAKKGGLVSEKHPVAKQTTDLIEKFKKNNKNIELTCASDNSLLNKVIPYEPII